MPRYPRRKNTGRFCPPVSPAGTELRSSCRSHRIPGSQKNKHEQQQSGFPIRANHLPLKEKQKQQTSNTTATRDLGHSSPQHLRALPHLCPSMTDKLMCALFPSGVTGYAFPCSKSWGSQARAADQEKEDEPALHPNPLLGFRVEFVPLGRPT